MNKIQNSIIAWYSIFLGIVVVALWVFILTHGAIPEGRTEMTFHVFSELLMAVFCVAGGFGLMRHGRQDLNIAAHAMVLYSLINAAGYYAEREEYAVTVVFAVLFILSFLVLRTHLKRIIPFVGQKSRQIH